MKVEGPSPTGKVGRAKKSAKTSAAKGAGFSKALQGAQSDEESVDESSVLAGGAALGSVDALIALQGVDEVDAADPDAPRRNQAAKQRAEDLLNRLDEIRIGLLSGGLPRERLVQLSQALSSRQGRAADPQLQAVLDEIELRVAVELAKHHNEV